MKPKTTEVLFALKHILSDNKWKLNHLILAQLQERKLYHNYSISNLNQLSFYLKQIAEHKTEIVNGTTYSFWRLKKWKPKKIKGVRK